MMKFKEFLLYLWEVESRTIVIAYIVMIIAFTTLSWRQQDKERKIWKKIIYSLAYSIIGIVVATLIVLAILYWLGR